jgi:hypothetical protein
MDQALNLPVDLVDFLRLGLKLDHAAESEAGAIELLPMESLCLQLFPTDVDNGPIDNSTDPHCREMGCYMVPAVSLVATCENYDPLGLILWFPNERCFGTWDSSHTLLESFSTDVTWTDIAREPVRYLNAFWGEARVGGLAPFRPWPRYEYDPKQPHQPR